MAPGAAPSPARSHARGGVRTAFGVACLVLACLSPTTTASAAMRWAGPVRLPISGGAVDGESEGLRMVATRDGATYVAWQRDAGATSTVEEMWIAAGGRRSRPRRISLPGRQGYLDGLLADGSGGATVIWSDGPREQEDPQRWSVRARRIHRGRLKAPIFIFGDYANAPRPNAALRDDGAIDLVWSGASLGSSFGSTIPGAPADFDAAVGLATLLPDGSVLPPRWIWSPSDDGIRGYSACISHDAHTPGAVAIVRRPGMPGLVAWVLGEEFGSPAGERIYTARIGADSSVSRPVASAREPTLLEACEAPMLAEDRLGTGFVAWQHRLDLDVETSTADVLQVQSVSASGAAGPVRAFGPPPGRGLGGGIWLGPNAKGAVDFAYSAFRRGPVVGAMDILLQPADLERAPSRSILLPAGRGTDQWNVALVGEPAPRTLAIWGDRSFNVNIAAVNGASHIGKARVLSHRYGFPSDVHAATPDGRRLSVMWREQSQGRNAYWLMRKAPQARHR